MADSCDFGRLLNKPFDKLLNGQQTGRKNIKELDDDLHCILLCGEPDYFRKRIMFL